MAKDRLKLWRLERLDNVDYDDTRAAVVIAASERDARQLLYDADKSYRPNGRESWLTCGGSSCKWVGDALASAEPGVVLTDVHES